MFTDSKDKYQIVGSSCFKPAFINKNGALSKQFRNTVFKHTHSVSHSRPEFQIIKFNENCIDMSFDELKLINLKSQRDLFSKIEALNLHNDFEMKMELNKERVIY